MKVKLKRILQFAVVVFAETDCDKVRSFLYPDAASCPNEMKCSKDYACVVDKDDCGLYKCVAASDCPEGTSYAVFNPHRGSSRDARINATNQDEGYFCDPDGLQCYFDSNNNFIIHAVVDNRNPWIDGPADDDVKRKITLISKTKHDQHVDGAFKQFHDSTCIGVETDDGTKVRFHKKVDDPLCKDEFDFDYVYSVVNGLTYIVDFFIGFDDYWIIDEFNQGSEFAKILRGGVSNQFQCRIKASDNGWIDPNPESSRKYTYEEVEGQIPFEFNAYYDREFSKKYEGALVELDEDQVQDGLYVEARHGGSIMFEDHIMHLRECTSYNFEKIGEHADGSAIYEDEPSATYAFLNAGCIPGDYSWYSQKSTGDRTEWTSNVKTYVNDQFNLKLKADSGSSSGGSKLKYSCEMVLCPLEVFGINGETAPGSPCYLSKQCANRYNNLFSTRNVVNSLKEGTVVQIKTIHDEGFLYTDVIQQGSDAYAIGFSFIGILLLAF